ncbi:hypothetical protein L914_07363 [Phytophthora nicotianae]|uniref:Uncharacterized protein n=1 Tax=Phytophthora nicotianae TaxID=4792 RepID=W2NK47_PHYNI|nr:hypothetical protein L914_07363 [Phytophthora nicotianae]
MPEVRRDALAAVTQALPQCKKAKKARTKRLGELLPTADRTVLVNGVLELPYCPDSGSDHTVIGQSHWKQLLALDPEVQVEQLEAPVHSQTFGDNKVTAVQKAMLQVRIHTAVGPVEPMGLVGVLIVDCDDDEFIVGNDLLRLLGINVNRQLEQLASRGDDELAGDPIHLEADEVPVRVNDFPQVTMWPFLLRWRLLLIVLWIVVFHWMTWINYAQLCMRMTFGDWSYARILRQRYRRWK